MGSSDDDDILNDLCVDVILARSECTALAFWQLHRLVGLNHSWLSLASLASRKVSI